MTSIILSIVGIFLGALISYWISRYFYLKGIKEASLTPYLHFSTTVFSKFGDKSLHDKLQVYYDDTKIDNLFQIQFVIANTGTLPIKNVLKPLELKVPKSKQILDVDIIHVQPEDREVACIKEKINSENKIIFSFSLLNPKEYFVVRILLKSNDITDKDPIQDLKFNITAEELPSVLNIENLPQEYLLNKQIKFDYIPGLISLLLFVFSLSFAISLYTFSETNPELLIFNVNDFFSKFGITSAFVLLSWIGVISLIFLSVILGYIFFDINKQNQKVIVLPEEITNAL